MFLRGKKYRNVTPILGVLISEGANDGVNRVMLNRRRKS
jgi:hypothetical protein